MPTPFRSPATPTRTGAGPAACTPGTRRTSRPSRLLAVLGLAGAAVLGLALPASAHVTVAADDASRGAADAILTFRVPNESDTARTVKVEIKFPVKNPIAAVKPAAVPGWTVTTSTVTFNPPISTDDGKITSGIGDVVYTANSPADGIAPGRFAAFPILVGPLPDVTALTFPTVQTYSDGKVSSWVEPVTDPANLPENAAPVLTLTAARSAGTGSGAAPAAADTGSGSTTGSGSGSGAATGGGGSGSGTAFGITGTVLGALGLVVGGLALLRSRRRRDHQE